MRIVVEVQSGVVEVYADKPNVTVFIVDRDAEAQGDPGITTCEATLDRGLVDMTEDQA